MPFWPAPTLTAFATLLSVIEPAVALLSVMTSDWLVSRSSRVPRLRAAPFTVKGLPELLLLLNSTSTVVAAVGVIGAV